MPYGLVTLLLLFFVNISSVPEVEALIMVDINSDSANKLQGLGLTPVEAQQVIANRPFRKREELKKKAGLTQTSYDLIQNAVMVVPLDINSANRNQLAALGLNIVEVEKLIQKRPYSDTKELVAKEIVTKKTYDDNKLEEVIRAVYRPSEQSGMMFFFIGAEYTLEEKAGQKNFAKPFPYIGLRANYLIDNRTDDAKDKNESCNRHIFDPNCYSSGKLRTQLDFRLVSTAVEKFDPSNPSNTNLSPERSFDANVTVAWMTFITDRPSNNKGLSVWEIGPMAKVGGQTTETGQNFFWRTALGLRFMETGELLNGTYFDIGYGYSGNFLQPKYRMKVDAFVPLYQLGVPLFLQTTLETDFGSKPDLVKIGFGTFFDTSQIIDKIKKLAS